MVFNKQIDFIDPLYFMYAQLIEFQVLVNRDTSSKYDPAMFSYKNNNKFRLSQRLTFDHDNAVLWKTTILVLRAC